MFISPFLPSAQKTHPLAELPAHGIKEQNYLLSTFSAATEDEIASFLESDEWEDFFKSIFLKTQEEIESAEVRNQFDQAWQKSQSSSVGENQVHASLSLYHFIEHSLIFSRLYLASIFCALLQSSPSFIERIKEDLSTAPIQEQNSAQEAFFKACENGLSDVVSLFLQCGWDFLFASDPIGRTPLHLAVEQEHFDLLPILAQGGCNINERSRKTGLTPFSAAVLQKKRGLVRF